MIRAEERIRAVAAEPAVAEHLRVAAGTPLLCVDRIAFTYGDMPWSGEGAFASPTDSPITTSSREVPAAHAGKPESPRGRGGIAMCGRSKSTVESPGFRRRGEGVPLLSRGRRAAATTPRTGQ